MEQVYECLRSSNDLNMSSALLFFFSYFLFRKREGKRYFSNNKSISISNSSQYTLRVPLHLLYTVQTNPTKFLDLQHILSRGIQPVKSNQDYQQFNTHENWLGLSIPMKIGSQHQCNIYYRYALGLITVTKQNITVFSTLPKKIPSTLNNENPP